MLLFVFLFVIVCFDVCVGVLCVLFVVFLVLFVVCFVLLCFVFERQIMKKYMFFLVVLGCMLKMKKIVSQTGLYIVVIISYILICMIEIRKCLDFVDILQHNL